MNRDRIEELREYGRNYYWTNREQILAKQRQLSEESKISKKLSRSWLTMLDEWEKKLTKRLKDEDLQDGWLRFALERMIDIINERKETIQKDRQPGL